MMTLEELIQKYANVPVELKTLRRWVCFKVEGMENNKTTKRPYNAINGKLAKVNDELTWSTFDIALKGCSKYKCDGIGFILGCGIFGIDLDNHVDENGVAPMTEEEFKEFSTEFIETLDSYTELSQSGKGIHIICQGKLPSGPRRKGCVEMYDSGRFFAFTGNAIKNIPIMNREEEIKPLYEKHINVKNNFDRPVSTPRYSSTERQELKLSDSEIINAALASRQGGEFYKYYHDGDISSNNNDASSADMSFCNMLAFWCNGDTDQMDRIFRSSALMRDKWDEKRGERTYGEITISSAVNMMRTGYVKTAPIENGPKFNIKDPNKIKQNGVEYTVNDEGEVISNDMNNIEMNIDSEGEPIFHIKKIYTKFPYTDTGNAERFYAYFGDIFRYNVTDKIFMFWTGKTWVKDYKKIIRKYANQLIQILRDEESNIQQQIDEHMSKGNINEANKLTKILDASKKNTSRISNKSGKDAMLYEFETLYDVPVESSVFNNDDYLLNTESGIVDLRTGSLMPFDKEKYISKNTGTKVSYEEPTEWLKFLHSVFDNGDEKQTQEMIDSLQTCLGYSLTGLTKEQCMFLLYGGGSNGKSTLTETIARIIGDYGENIDSSVLMQQKNVNSTAVYSIAKLQTARFVETGETDDGGKLAEAQLKKLTGSDKISAQFKFGNEFSFYPKFKIWMSTNNKPIIRGTDLGIWRRMFLFPFLNSFTGDKKDKNLPEKLANESDKILGWCVQGCMKYLESGLIEPERAKTAKEEYKEQMDIISQFIRKECMLDECYSVNCKVLYAHYKEWAIDNTEFTMKESRFAEELQKKGITIKKSCVNPPVYKGIKVVGIPC